MTDRQVHNVPNWDFLSRLIIITFFVVQSIHWDMLLQFMDVYYHLLTAWGFVQAGGYTNWDFWQYAPVGRVHIYPPLFHIAFAGLIKIGINQIILAKLLEILLPSCFLYLLWRFIKRYFTRRLAFFVLLLFFSSFSFYLSLVNHAPCTLAFIFGILSLCQLLEKKILRAALLLSLAFYTHIGVSWFFALTFIVYSIFNRESRKRLYLTLLITLVIALPINIHELNSLRFITNPGFSLTEKYLSQIKVIESLFCIFGLVIAWKRKNTHFLLVSFFLASFMFILYPYRFFSGEGYFAVILLSALFIDYLYQRFNKKYVLPLIIAFVLFLTPTLSFNIDSKDWLVTVKPKFFDSGFNNIILAKGRISWFPDEYTSAARIVRENSEKEDIVFCTLNFLGLTIGDLAGRATANGLLPEIQPKNYNPLASSKIIIFSQIDDPAVTGKIINAFRLVKIGENKFFMIYKNPACKFKMIVSKAILPFWLIYLIVLVWLWGFWKADKADNFLNKYLKNI